MYYLGAWEYDQQEDKLLLYEVYTPRQGPGQKLYRCANNKGRETVWCDCLYEWMDLYVWLP